MNLFHDQLTHFMMLLSVIYSLFELDVVCPCALLSKEKSTHSHMGLDKHGDEQMMTILILSELFFIILIILSTAYYCLCHSH